MSILLLLISACAGECPDARPSIGSGCDDRGLKCEYPAPGCGDSSGSIDTMTCTKSGWQTDGTHCDPSMPPCPMSLPELGSPCNYPLLGPCSYRAPGCDASSGIWTIFTCESSRWVSDGARCGDAGGQSTDASLYYPDASVYHEDAGDGLDATDRLECPPARPELNGTCQAIGTECNYPAPGCDPELGLTETFSCGEGGWTSDHIRCPDCAETRPAVGSLCLPIGFECKYPAPGCGSLDVYVTYTCGLSGWMSDGTHCDPI